MIEKYFENKKVKDIIFQINSNESYYKKEYNSSIYLFSNDKLIALFTLYDAIIKYFIVIEDLTYYDYFLSHIDKSFKRINNYESLNLAINNVIINCVKELIRSENKKDIVTYIYKKYIEEGYYYHGFSSVYYNDIIKNGFISEEYTNYYEKFREVNKIFSKYNLDNYIEKDFSLKTVSFTDDFLRSCFYSVYGPMYYSNFLNSDNDYLGSDYSLVITNINKVMSDNSFSEEDKKKVLDIISLEWELLHKVEKNVNIILVKRDKIKDNISLIDDYINDDNELEEVVDKIFSSKNLDISFDGHLSLSDMIVLKLDLFKEKEEVVQSNEVILNEDGGVSYLLLISSLFICLGVIITIITLVRG